MGNKTIWTSLTAIEISDHGGGLFRLSVAEDYMGGLECFEYLSGEQILEMANAIIKYMEDEEGDGNS